MRASGKALISWGKNEKYVSRLNILTSLKRPGHENIFITMHNKFSNFFGFASLSAHLCAISNNFNCNDENRILGK